ncbi:MAG: hypothetical protein U1E28_03970 [Beijerinckiaceae bacterium]
MRLASTIAVVVCAASVCAAEDSRRPVATGAELDARLSSCFHPPAGSAGSEITLAFMLDRNGALVGKPRISHSKLVGDERTQRAFVASALRMLQDCTPVAMTEEFGARAANKLRAWRLRSAPPGTSL